MGNSFSRRGQTTARTSLKNIRVADDPGDLWGIGQKKLSRMGIAKISMSSPTLEIWPRSSRSDSSLKNRRRSRRITNPVDVVHSFCAII